jgi:hypothetical protein
LIMPETDIILKARRWSLALLIACVAQTALARPAQIILLRHAEKPPEHFAVHLDERGEARARALAYFLTTNKVFLSDGPPTALFAPEFTVRGHGRRPYETLQPLAERLHLPIQTPYGSKDAASLANLILNDPALDGKTVVVCWVHEELPALAKKLGVKPEPGAWDSRIYDRIWLISYHKHRAILTTLAQGLLPGDARPDSNINSQGEPGP